jgi:hypothetical protein
VVHGRIVDGELLGGIDISIVVVVVVAAPKVMEAVCGDNDVLEGAREGRVP